MSVVGVLECALDICVTALVGYGLWRWYRGGVQRTSTKAAVVFGLVGVVAWAASSLLFDFGVEAHTPFGLNASTVCFFAAMLLVVLALIAFLAAVVSLLLSVLKTQRAQHAITAQHLGTAPTA